MSFASSTSRRRRPGCWPTAGMSWKDTRRRIPFRSPDAPLVMVRSAVRFFLANTVIWRFGISYWGGQRGLCRKMSSPWPLWPGRPVLTPASPNRSPSDWRCPARLIFGLRKSQGKHRPERAALGGHGLRSLAQSGVIHAGHRVANHHPAAVDRLEPSFHRVARGTFDCHSPFAHF